MSDCDKCNGSGAIKGEPAVDKDGNELETFKVCDCCRYPAKKEIKPINIKYNDKKQWWEEQP